MTTLFCLRPATRNIGNDIINTATTEVLLETFGAQTAIVNVPAMRGAQFGGLDARQVYDMNRLADGVIIGGGNLFENGQITVDLAALSALRVPAMILGVSHGRVRAAGEELTGRSDAIPEPILRALVGKASQCYVRDLATLRILQDLGLTKVALGGCPTLFLPANQQGQASSGRVLLSIRHPDRMSVPVALQWRIPDHVRRLIAGLSDMYGSDNVRLVCHDYKDIEFAQGFPEAEMMYFDSPVLYMEELRKCRQSITFRLHAFLPCFAFGVPSIHLSYDERGRSMMATIGMQDWDIDILDDANPVERALASCHEVETYRRMRRSALGKVARIRAKFEAGVMEFADHVRDYRRTRRQ